MLHLFSLTGEPSEKHYLLMNGDLVDRGSWSIEVILTAFAFKCMRAKFSFKRFTDTRTQGSTRGSCTSTAATTKQRT
jgi:hypothetical protein